VSPTVFKVKIQAARLKLEAMPDAGRKSAATGRAGAVREAR